MIQRSDIVPCPPDYDDPFAPMVGETRAVRCLHCDQSYTEDKVIYGKKPDVDPTGDVMWWCPTPGCDGAGVGFDIHFVGGPLFPDEPAAS